MSAIPSVALRNGLLQGTSVKEMLDNGFIYFYAGPVPVDADAALDMVGAHTQLAKITADAVPADAGTTGLQFAATASGGAIAKLASQTWAAKINFVGKDAAQAGVGPLTATFARFCSAADNGQAAGGAGTPRLQGLIGTAGAEFNLTSVSLSDNASNTTGLSSFEVRQPAS